MMKFKNLLLVIMLVGSSMATLAQSVTINRSNATLESVLLEIADQTNYTLNYSLEVIGADRRVNLFVNQEPLIDVLEELFAGTQIEFNINEDSVDFMIKSVSAQDVATAKKVNISGVVVDDDDQPIIGATIMVKGSSNGTVTALDGSFSLKSVTSADQISISYIGYNTQLITIGSQSHIKISLQSSAVDISEVVVVGYGVQKRSDITGSVASVKASELISSPTASTAEALQGKVSGVMIQNASGSPSGNVTIRIRGANSLTYGNDPLIIVDGVQSSSISSLNPNEVESVEVLKDAAALSVYGSRGANGVILVTTKSGVRNVPAEVSYNGYLSFDNVSKTLPAMDASQYGGLYNEFYKAENGIPFFSDDELKGLGVGTNWQDEIFRAAFSQNHNVSVGGSNDKISYFVSGSLLDKEGIILNSDYRQYTFRSNLKVRATDFFNFGVNLALDSSKESGGNSGAALDAALQWSPTKGVYESDGSYVQPGGGIGPNDKYNPVGLANEYVNDKWGTNVTITPNVELSFSENLKFTSMLSYRYDGNNIGYFDNQVANNGPVESTSGSLTTSTYSSLQNTNILSFNKEFGDHSIGITGVYEIFSDQYKGNTSSAQGVPINLGYNGLQFGSTLLAPWVDSSSSALSSVMGRINYSYKDKYMFSLSDRYDGASQLAEGNKWDNFMAVSAGWNIMKEPFMSRYTNVINELKLRGSYGSVGNSAVKPYASLQKFYSGYDASGNTIIAIAQIANKDLGWERTTEWNIGLDARLLNGRINLSAEYYDKTTTDLLMWKAVPDVMGVDSQLTNVGSVGNKGFDFSISGYPVNTRNFKWNTNLTFNHNKNEILALDGLNDQIIADGDADFPGLTGSFVQQVGQPMGTFLGYVYEGVWQSNEASIAAVYGAVPGDAKYADVNNDQTIDSDDITIIGNAQPKYIFGWNNTFTYKNWDLNMFWQGVAGNDIYNQNRIKRESFQTGFPNNPIALDYWRVGQESSTIPSLTGKEFTNSSRWVENGSYLRMKSLTLGYSFSSSLLEKSGFISLAKVYVSATNLITLTNYSGFDPEASIGRDGVAAGVDRGVYPSSKGVIVGVNLKF